MVPGLPQEFLRHVQQLEGHYLQHQDPILQSGFHGGPERWRQERGPILEAIERDGDLLDVGCANGYLLECLVNWASERPVHLVPHGVDIGSRLIALARQRMPQYAANFYVANAWDWEPPRRYRYVYALYDCVPATHLGAYVRRLLDRAVAPGGRLIVGGYGSRSRGVAPPDLAGWLRSSGLNVAGQALGGQPAITAFAWVDHPG